MKPAHPSAGRAGDMIMLIMFTMLFPLTANLHAHPPSTNHQLLAGVLLGGLAALSKALLYDGYRRWRTHGFAQLERTRSLRVLVTTLVYPALGGLTIVIWLVGTTEPNFGAAYGLGALIGSSVMGWRAMAILTRKRQLDH